MFDRERPTEQPSTFVPLIRVRNGTPTTLLITGDRRWTFTHFAKRRTWPCIGPGCPWCRLHFSRRLYAYYPCLSKDRKPAILELTALAASELEKQHQSFRDDPIGIVTLQRVSKSKNATLQVLWKEATEPLQEEARQAEKPDVEASMMKIWQLPSCTEHTDQEEYQLAVRTVLEAAAGQPAPDGSCTASRD